VGQMIAAHLAKRAEVTVATIPKPVTQCYQFSTVTVSPGWQVRGFDENPSEPTPFPGHPDHALVSMDNYIFNYDVLLEELEADAADKDSRHDFGRDVLPKICQRRSVYAYDFRSNSIPGVAGPTDYWRDAGTIQSYFRATMDLNNPLSHLPLFGDAWPLMGRSPRQWPARIGCNLSGRSGCVENSILGNSTIVVGAYVRDSVIGPNVRILSHAVVEESIILGEAVIGEGAKVRRAIIDEGNVIGRGEKVGHDREQDAARYYVDKTGIVVVPEIGAVRRSRSTEPRRLGPQASELRM
jgi:glucose-1-phosphate adenylyltransferase